MPLQAIYDSPDDIPDSVNFRELFTEKGGKYELTGIGGLKTDADVSRLQASLSNERKAHKDTRDKLSMWGDLDHDEVVSKLDRLPELEAAAKGALDDAKVEEIVARRVDGTLRSRVSPLERQIKTLQEERDEARAVLAKLEERERQRVIRGAIREAATAAKMRPEAVQDAEAIGAGFFEVTEDGKVVTREESGATPGMDPAGWLTDVQSSRPHWWPEPVGGGSRGSHGGGGFGGPNPFSHDGWNMTEQGRIYRENPKRAEQMALAAGTTVGGSRPKPRVPTGR